MPSLPSPVNAPGWKARHRSARFRPKLAYLCCKTSYGDATIIIAKPRLSSFARKGGGAPGGSRRVGNGLIGGQFRGHLGPLGRHGGQQELTAAQGIGCSRCKFPLAPCWLRKWYLFKPRPKEYFCNSMFQYASPVIIGRRTVPKVNSKAGRFVFYTPPKLNM
jgi:hypothetical protein